MSKQFIELNKILKREGFSGEECCQYYREVEFNGRWRLFDVLEDMLLAYSVIRGDMEIIVVMNTSYIREIENRVTVDRSLSPAGSKLKDIAGKSESYIVEEHEGRNFVTVKLKPDSFAVLRVV